MKNQNAVSLGQLGGRARAAKLSPEQRSEAARQAANSRWKNEPAVVQAEQKPGDMSRLHPEFARRLQNGLIPATPDEIKDLLSKSQDDLISIWRSIRTGQAKTLGEALQGE